MINSRFTETQIVFVLKEHESGRWAEDICRKLGITKVAFYKLCLCYGGMEAGDITQLKSLEVENARLKRMFADLSLVHKALKMR